MNNRERLGSRLGFILLSAGCAIGCGNVWKFPWMAGQNGGGGFVLIYVLCLIVLGLPVMIMEFSLGRASQASPVKMYQELEPKGSKWHIHGIFALIGNVILMMFYTNVSGWMLQYFFKTASGEHFEECISSDLFGFIYFHLRCLVTFYQFGECGRIRAKASDKVVYILGPAVPVYMTQFSCKLWCRTQNL